MVVALAAWLEGLITVAAVAGALLLLWLVWRLVCKRVPETIAQLVDQLIPVLVVAGIVVAVLVVIDPDQAELLIDGVIRYIPVALVAIIVVTLARALGRILGLFVETALRPVSDVMAVRGRLITSSLILGVGLIIALQQLGVSTDIILILVAAFVFGTALAAALAVGLGAVPLARQVAAGRHVKERHSEGQLIRIGELEGRVERIGLATTRVEAMDGGSIEVPNDEFLGTNVEILR